MGKCITNKDVMKMFKDISEIQDKTDIIRLQNNIVEKLDFLVYSVTKRYKKFPNYEDLVQEGFVSLLVSVRNFDHTRYPNFFTWAEKRMIRNIRKVASKFDVVYSPDKKRVLYSEPSNMDDEEVEYTPEKQYFVIEQNEVLNNVINNLSCREKSIIKKSFGIAQDTHTLRDLGHIHGLTHERIRQIKNRTVSKLRKLKAVQEIY